MIRRPRTTPCRWSRPWFVVATMLLAIAVVVSPVAARADVVDPGLDLIMTLTPPGYHRAERDRLPEGPMTAGTFNRIGATAVPVRADDAVVYGASYERSDRAFLIFLGMSTTQRADAQAFADRVIAGSLTNSKPFSVGIDGVAGVEGDSNGTPAAAIAFARNGRGFAVLSFGTTAREDGAAFATIVEGMAESTFPRGDAKAVDQLQPAVVAVAAAVALSLFGLMALWRFTRRRPSAARRVEPMVQRGEPASSRVGEPDLTDTIEHRLAEASPPRSPRPNPR